MTERHLMTCKAVSAFDLFSNSKTIDFFVRLKVQSPSNVEFANTCVTILSMAHGIIPSLYFRTFVEFKRKLIFKTFAKSE